MANDGGRTEPGARQLSQSLAEHTDSARTSTTYSCPSNSSRTSPSSRFGTYGGANGSGRFFSCSSALGAPALKSGVGRGGLLCSAGHSRISNCAPDGRGSQWACPWWMEACMKRHHYPVAILRDMHEGAVRGSTIGVHELVRGGKGGCWMRAGLTSTSFSTCLCTVDGKK